METITDTFEGDLHVTSHLVVRGLVTGNIYVEDGGSLDLHGLCSGSVSVETGGEANIHGLISTDLINRGGTVFVAGMINGTLKEHSGETRVARGACISKRAKM